MTGPELQMPTTVGSVALRSAMARKNAPIVDMVCQAIASSHVPGADDMKLVRAGAIIIGKANLSVRRYISPVLDLN